MVEFIKEEEGLCYGKLKYVVKSNTFTHSIYTNIPKSNTNIHSIEKVLWWIKNLHRVFFANPSYLRSSELKKRFRG